MKHTYVLDTCICSFIMREHPIEVLQKLQAVSGVSANRHLSDHLFRKALRSGKQENIAKVNDWINQFVNRLDAILPWDAQAVDQSAQIKNNCVKLERLLAAMIWQWGHALATGSIVVTNNTESSIVLGGSRLKTG